MITIRVTNIHYDTVDCDRIERRLEIDPLDIPEEVTLYLDLQEVEQQPFDALDGFVLKRVENDWLVDRFDYEVLAPQMSGPHHVECQCREAYGAPFVWPAFDLMHPQLVEAAARAGIPWPPIP